MQEIVHANIKLWEFGNLQLPFPVTFYVGVSCGTLYIEEQLGVEFQRASSALWNFKTCYTIQNSITISFVTWRDPHALNVW